ncbi:MAG TPA: membrane protein insertase YidC [Verrucomicrobiae bacterium]|jgi:YidC/Oxa1 family membrane protein insertase|nr:membrane protein insertase YidC [Verrucomicrobiae bacterium]
MDRKSIIILVAAAGLLLGLSPIIDHFFPPKRVPLPALTNEVASVTNSAGATNLPVSNSPVAAVPGAPRTSAAPTPSGPETFLTISNAEVVCHFTSRGGGIKQIDLTDYPAVTRRSAETKAPTRPASLNTGAPVPVGALVGGDELATDEFVLSRHGNVVRAERTLPNGVRIVKEFDFGTNYAFKSVDLGSATNHLFNVRVRYENTSAQAALIPTREFVIGTAAPIGPLDDPTTYGSYWYNGSKAQNIKDTWFANRTLGCFPGTPRYNYQEGAGNVVWAAVHNQFFALAAIPAKPASEVVIHKIILPAPDTNGIDAAPRYVLTNGYQAALSYGAASLAPGQSIETSTLFYAGPKEYNVLSKLGLEMGNNVDAIMDFSGPSGFFSKGLLICMNGLHTTGIGYGWCIIGITVIIKLIFWPLTASATRSQKRLQALQPQIKAISDKYKDDPAKKNEKTMEFMKQNKVNPMGSCLPTLLQIPVFFGFYYMLRSAIELRGVHFLWAYDLSQPDTIFYLAGFPINPLPLVMGATQFWQMHMTPPSPGMDPGQQKIMKFMPLMFLVFFYRMSAGLTLYWTVSNLLSILQMKTTRTAPDDVPALAPARKKK